MNLNGSPTRIPSSQVSAQIMTTLDTNLMPMDTLLLELLSAEMKKPDYCEQLSVHKKNLLSLKRSFTQLPGARVP